MTDIFAEVRERVTAKEAATRYGLEVKRDFACCPFHGEKTASLHFHDGGFYCFGCHAGGSSIDFTARLFGLDAVGAVRRLNEDFALNLPIDQPATPEDREKARKRKETAELHAQFERWRVDMVNRLNACYRHAHRLKQSITDLAALSDRDVLALKYQTTFEYWADLLTDGTAAQQMTLYRQRKELRVLTERILNNTPMK